MWYSTHHRKTVHACSRTAYLLISIGELVWQLSLGGLLLAVLGAVWLGVQGDWRGWWLPLVPLASGALSFAMRRGASKLLEESGYRYDYSTDTATLNGREPMP
ncbi:MAG: hypothetical protein GWP66_10175 [Gammaproteobacteria bacterium]|jgi:hypothetical protein|nr:hypothetical protein [Gammaproteobacteria bacterium]